MPKLKRREIVIISKLLTTINALRELFYTISLLLQGKLEVNLRVILWTRTDELRGISVRFH